MGDGWVKDQRPYGLFKERSERGLGSMSGGNQKKGSTKNKNYMSRSIWKLPFSEVPFFPGKAELKTNVWSRRSMVLPHFVGKSFLIHNGKIFIPLKVSEDMIGHKFGEFATTRKRPVHKLNKKKQPSKR